MSWVEETNIRGPQGEVGPPGAGVVFKGTVPTYANLPVGAANGDMYITEDDGHGWVWDGDSWIDTGQMQGSEGPQGPIGPAGPQGSTGATGSQGPQGIQGPQGVKGDTGNTGSTGSTGAPGPANTLAIGTVTTVAPGGAATSTITGASPNQTLNLGIPRGDVGATGSTGSTGAQGNPGPANSLAIGTVTTGAAGSSAAANITGTPPTQTLSMTIPRGDTGAQGIQGIQGPAGAGAPGTAPPLMNGTATVGVTTLFSREDHIHPSDTSRLAASAYTAADVLTKIKTVDGASSGLDADLLDGQDGAYYLSLTNATGTLPAARFDDTAHGSRGGGTLHPAVTTSVNGFMSAADKVTFNAIPTTYAPIASPTLTGDPKSVTPATSDNDTSIATTAFVKAQGYAPLASPALTGTPTVPTATAGTNTTQAASSAFVMAAIAPLFGAIRVQAFTANGTYTPHANMLYCIIECTGSGGAGGGVTGTAGSSTTASGGGGGAYARKICTKAQIGASKPVTIGAVSASTHPSLDGAAGGSTSVGTLCVATGGAGGTRAQTGVIIDRGGYGGTVAGCTGDMAVAGGDGGGGMGQSGGIFYFCGWGGASGGGMGGQTTVNLQAHGRGGSAYGGGGSGGQTLDASSWYGGGGGAGLVFITEFCSS